MYKQANVYTNKQQIGLYSGPMLQTFHNTILDDLRQKNDDERNTKYQHVPRKGDITFNLFLLFYEL